MPQDFLPFSRPAVTEQDIEAVAQVLRSGWITTGPRCADLEQRFCELTGAKYAVAASSATAALHLYLLALGIGPGDEVITPSLTWVSTANIICLLGATPVFVDIDRDTLMVSAAAIDQAISIRTRLIIPVHFAGAALDMDPIRQIAAARGIPVLEDAAHALGTTYNGVPVGRDGDAIFSLQAIKNVTAAEGGVFVTNDPELARRMRRLRFHGIDVDSHDRQTQGRSPQAQVMEPGFKYNLPDLCAALALSQMARLEAINAQRADLAAHYLKRLQGLPRALPLLQPTWVQHHSWHLMVVRIEPAESMDRNRFIERMKELQIGCGIHFRAIHEQHYYRLNAVSKQYSLTNTEWNSARICSLPLFPDMQLQDVDRVVDTMQDILI